MNTPTDTELLNQIVATLAAIAMTAKRQNPAADTDPERLQVIADLADALRAQIRAEFERRAAETQADFERDRTDRLKREAEEQSGAQAVWVNEGGAE